MHDEELDKITGADEETRAKYLREKTDLLKRLDTINAVLDALGEKSELVELAIPTEGALPVNCDIVKYLTQQGEPCHQRDIIKAVGDKLKEASPHRRHPYGDVWRSLESHDRHDLKVVCVELKDGKICRAELKPKPDQPRIKGGRVDRAEFYVSPDNLFGLATWIGNKESES